MNKHYPTSKQLQKLSNKVKNGEIFQKLTGKDLLNPNLERKLLSDNKHNTIDANVEEIWASLTTQRQQHLMNLADSINRIQNSYTIEQIGRINTPQVANTTLESDFYNGTKFHEDKSAEFYILPLGMVYGR
ncbi:hypothetical protein RclHR1_03140013 [Rhizophagus clarus]|nr:hypothetical protein RclHR1_03140013 [Rhizophagus clarus]